MRYFAMLCILLLSACNQDQKQSIPTKNGHETTTICLDKQLYQKYDNLDGAFILEGQTC